MKYMSEFFGNRMVKYLTSALLFVCLHLIEVTMTIQINIGNKYFPNKRSKNRFHEYGWWMDVMSGIFRSTVAQIHNVCF